MGVAIPFFFRPVELEIDGVHRTLVEGTRTLSGRSRWRGIRVHSGGHARPAERSLLPNNSLRISGRSEINVVSKTSGLRTINGGPEREKKNPIADGLDPGQSSNRHRELGSRGTAVARGNSHRPLAVVSGNGTAVLGVRQRWKSCATQPYSLSESFLSAHPQRVDLRLITRAHRARILKSHAPDLGIPPARVGRLMALREAKLRYATALRKHGTASTGVKNHAYPA